MKKVLFLIMIFFNLIFISGCGVKEVNTEQKKYETKFVNMPERNHEIANVYVSGDVALFEFIVPGLDSSVSEIVSYSLTDDNLLGNINLNAGVFKIFPLSNGKFYVVDLNSSRYTLYDKNCKEIESKILLDGNSGISFVSISDDGKYILYQKMDDSKIFNYNIKTKKNTELSSDGEWYNSARYNDSKCYLFGDQILTINPKNNSLSKIENSIDAITSNDKYLIGKQASYITLYSFDTKEFKMLNLVNDLENIIDAKDNLLITGYSDNNNSKIYLYNFDKMELYYKEETNLLISAYMISNKQMIAIMFNNDSNVLEYKLINFSDFENVKSISLEKFDADVINEILELPDYIGSEKTVEISRRIEQNHGVRILYGDDLFDINGFGYNFTPIDEETAYKYMVLIENYLDYYPSGLLREAGLGRSLVIFLCSNLRVGGLNLYYGSYNITYIEVGGNDDYFLANLTHELGHALEHGISTELINGWLDLMPVDVIRAYGDGIDGITVEYTPDDKGRTPVWFYDVYGRSNEKEDRAVIFSAMYSSYSDNDKGNFKYEGLKKKTDYWSYMLRETYSSCKNVNKFKWEEVLN